MVLLRVLDEREAVELGHHHVGQHEVDGVLAHPGQGVPAVLGVQHLPRRPFEQGAGQLPVGGRVVHDEDACHDVVSGYPAAGTP